MAIFRPMLAANKIPPDLSRLSYPMLCSPKLDGIRCVIRDSVAYSRSMKPIRNRHIQGLLGRPELNGLDGELVVGTPTDAMAFRASGSGVMSAGGEPDFTYNVFDDFSQPELPFQQRLSMAHSRLDQASPHLVRVPHTTIQTEAALRAYYDSVLSLGYEGAILRDPSWRYKEGRSTLREGAMLKLKQFEDAEATIVGVEEMMKNHNLAEINELGYTERSSRKENLAGAGTLGALICQNQDGTLFKIGTGFDTAERDRLYRMGRSIIGQLAKYKWSVAGGYDKPRTAVYLGIRHPDDIS